MRVGNGRKIRTLALQVERPRLARKRVNGLRSVAGRKRGALPHNAPADHRKPRNARSSRARLKPSKRTYVAT